MGKGKIERKTKREKKDFRLGGTQEERESKVLLPSRRHREYICARAKKEEAAQERKRRESSQEGAA